MNIMSSDKDEGPILCNISIVETFMAEQGPMITF